MMSSQMSVVYCSQSSSTLCMQHMIYKALPPILLCMSSMNGHGLELEVSNLVVRG